MREILGEIRELHIKEREYVPNLWGVSPIGRDREGCSYMAQKVSRVRLNWRRCVRGGVLGMAVMTTYARGAQRQGCMGELVGAHGRTSKAPGCASVLVGFERGTRAGHCKVVRWRGRAPRGGR